MLGDSFGDTWLADAGVLRYGMGTLWFKVNQPPGLGPEGLIPQSAAILIGCCILFLPLPSDTLLSLEFL